VAGYPLWWAAFDGSDVVLGGALVLYLLPRLQGADRLWLLLLPTVVLGAVSGAVGWPITTALHSGWSTAGKLAAAVVTIGLGCAIVHATGRLVPRRAPRAAAEPVAVPLGGTT
jgi:hypothetical protein